LGMAFLSYVLDEGTLERGRGSNSCSRSFATPSAVPGPACGGGPRRGEKIWWPWSTRSELTFLRS